MSRILWKPAPPSPAHRSVSCSSAFSRSRRSRGRHWDGLVATAKESVGMPLFDRWPKAWRWGSRAYLPGQACCQTEQPPQPRTSFAGSMMKQAVHWPLGSDRTTSSLRSSRGHGSGWRISGKMQDASTCSPKLLGEKAVQICGLSPRLSQQRQKLRRHHHREPGHLVA